MTIKKKLLLAFFALLIIPTLVLQSWTYREMTEILEENVCQAERHALNSGIRGTKSVFFEMNRILVWLSKDTEVRELIENEINQEDSRENSFWYQQFRNSERILDRSQLLLMKYPFDILLIPKQGTAYGNCEETQIWAEKIRNTEWYPEILEQKNDKIRWMESASEKPELSSGVFFACLPIRSTSHPSENSGIAFISVSEDLICETLQQANPYGDAYLINDKGLILSSEDKGLLHTSIQDMARADQLSFSKDEDWVKARINGKEMYILRSDWLTEKWEVLTFIPDDYILGQFRETRVRMMMIFFVIVILALAAAVILAGVISRPIVRLSEIVKRVETGDLQVRVPEESDGEIGVLERNFNKMMDHMNGMMRELSLKEKKKQKAEMRALQAQINPHFLFNTLSSIRWASKDEKVEKMVLSLCTLLKACMSRGGNIITLGEECELLAQYIELNNLRHWGNVVFHNEISEALQTLELPRFLLQPLVENSIIHGFELKDGNGNIWLSARKNDRGIVISIQDDGCGFPENFVIKDPVEREHRNGSSLSGIALKNVQERLILNYGEEAWIHCRNEYISPDKLLGARVEIFIPDGKMPEEEQIILHKS